MPVAASRAFSSGIAGDRRQVSFARGEGARRLPVEISVHMKTRASAREALIGKRAADRRGRVIAAGRRWLASVAQRLESTLPARALRRFNAIDGRNRAVLLGGQAFTTVIPMLIVIAAVASRHGPTAVADRLTARFHVTGTTAQAFRTLFERPPGATSSVTVVGVVLLVVSLFSLTRAIQRTYEAAWRLPAIGVRGNLHGMGGLGLLVSSFLVLWLLGGAVRHLPAGTVFAFVLRIVAAIAIWLVLQTLLLSRRVPVRRLVPGAIVAGVGQAVLSLYSALWMPRVIKGDADEYGIVGITFALLAWLIVIGMAVVVAAVLSAEIGGAPSAGPLPTGEDAPASNDNR
jgi:membrane protein